MIDDSIIMNEYQNMESYFLEATEGKMLSPFYAQIFSGMMSLPGDLHPAGCRRHKLLFETYNVIAENCFDCYKIEIQPQTVIDLFKLSMLFKGFSFPKNNARKCFLRPRQDIPSHYSGLIYFKGTHEAKSVFRDIGPMLKEYLGKDIPVFIKRGCSEYAKAYPEYAKLDDDFEPKLQINDEWKNIEERFNKEGLANQFQPVPKEPYPDGFSFNDFLSMRTWLSYAKTIGDESYKNVTANAVEVIPGFKHAPFNPS